MSTKFFSSFSIFAVALALVLGAGFINTAKAVEGRGGEGYTLPPGQVNLFGLDQADNSVGAQRDRDRDANSRDRSNDFPQYGLGMQSQE